MFEILVIVLSVIIVILLVVVIVFAARKEPNRNQELLLELKDEYRKLQIDIIEHLHESSDKSKTSLNAFKDDIASRIDHNLNKINEQVGKQLGEGFKDNQETFTNVAERLQKIDSAQKNIEKLSSEVLSLNDLLTNKNTRGLFGEVQLYQILEVVFGNNKSLYEKQKELSNNKIADSVVYAPKPLGMIAIDSKFPLNAYENMINDKSEEKLTVKQFERVIRRHIDDIEDKYIIDGETSNYAIMFIPAEAIFAELNANHFNLVEYGIQKNVWITSPTTLVASLSIIQTIIHNIKRNEQTDLIIKELKLLGVEFDRFKQRFESVNKSAEKIIGDLNNVSITANKISKRFSEIEEVKF